MDQYEKICDIGKGSFGIVSKIKRKADGRILVWKELNYGKMSEKEKQQLVSEVNILRELRHPNIVKYYDRIIDKEKSRIYIVMEFCEQGDMGQLIKRCKKSKEYIPEEMAWKILSQMILGLFECHKRKEGKILHRDLKPGNVFIDSQNNVKLGDFGLSRIMGDQSVFAYTHVGTPYYMSPEQIDEQRYNHKCDIWSAGCVLYEIVCLRAPFEATNKIQLAYKIKLGEIERIPKQFSEELFEIIKSMISIEQDKRPSCEDLMKHPRICFVLRALRLKEMESNVRRKDEDVKKRAEIIKQKESLMVEKQANIEILKEKLQKLKVLKEKQMQMIKANKRINYSFREQENTSFREHEKKVNTSFREPDNKIVNLTKQNQNKDTVNMMETFGKNNTSVKSALKTNESFERIKKNERIEQITNKYINQSKPQYRPTFDSKTRQTYDSKTRQTYDSKTRQTENSKTRQTGIIGSSPSFHRQSPSMNSKSRTVVDRTSPAMSRTSASRQSPGIPKARNSIDRQSPSLYQKASPTMNSKASPSMNSNKRITNKPPIEPKQYGIEAQRKKLADLRNQVSRTQTTYLSGKYTNGSMSNRAPIVEKQFQKKEVMGQQRRHSATSFASKERQSPANTKPSPVGKQPLTRDYAQAQQSRSNYLQKRNDYMNRANSANLRQNHYNTITSNRPQSNTSMRTLETRNPAASTKNLRSALDEITQRIQTKYFN